MNLRAGPYLTNSLICPLFLATISCSPSPRLYVRYGNQLTQSDLKKILATNPLAKEQNLRVATLGKTQTLSHHVVQLRDREAPHVHKRHDLTVVALKGEGYLMLGEE